MGSAEGIETALSAQQIFGVPVWAVMSAGGIARLPILPGINELIIFADHDGAGLVAAKKCATRYANANIAGQIQFPPAVGGDWNDHLKGVSANAE